VQTTGKETPEADESSDSDSDDERGDDAGEPGDSEERSAA
jgi:hypothetical protein